MNTTTGTWLTYYARPLLTMLEADVLSEYRVHLAEHVAHAWLDPDCDFCVS